MQAVTILHPWPYAIRNLGKDLENRHWSPPPSLLNAGDWFALHGGVVPGTRRARMEAYRIATDLIDKHIADPAARQRLKRELRAEEGSLFVTGIFAVARYQETVRRSSSPWFDGDLAWTWEPIIHLPEPAPCRGAQKLWPVPGDVLEEVRNRYREALHVGGTSV